MNRIIIFITLALAALAPQRAAFAGDAPTKDQLEAAKKAFGEGKALYEEGKLPEAVEKFKESYKLSKNPLLLYNIGHTLDQAGDKDTALFYYRKFLADAPKGAAQRKDVTKRVEQIEQEKLEADLNGTTMPKTTTTTTTTTTKQPEETRPTVKAKPAGTYSATDFEHQMIEAAPPGKPLDVTAFVPEDSGWTVTLYYRGSGDAKFVGKTMKWRYKELVARIPGAKMEGSSIQYYVEAKDAEGNVVTRSGKSTSPNLVNIDATVAPRFYPDLTDDGDEVATSTQTRTGMEEDPLNRNRARQEVDPETGDGGRTSMGGGPMTGPVDTNPNQYSKKKWIATGIAGGLLAGAVLTYVLGKQQSSNLLADRDSRMGNTCMQPPCFEFDMYDIDVEKAGKRYNTWHTLTAVTGVIAGGVAAYYWYKERQLRKRRGGGSRPAAPAPPAHDEFAITPAIGNGFAGAAAVGRF